ncbi:helix-turn-helix transcriptional regulator [Caulobacter henricii]|uniref:helix-turn-helix transcriptional regulator n=1 Tax=Caulobacter henricii TaxID=69395 RepID=UPI001411B473|nr:LuxR family transcriptional regulator [Caulobacter henricii]
MDGVNGFSVQDLLDEMSKAVDLKLRFETLTKRLSAIGLDTVNYAVFVPPESGISNADVYFQTTLAEDFMTFYYDENFAESDPHVRRLREGHLSPYAWNENDLGLASLNEREVLNAGVEAGLRSTLCVPLPVPLNPFTPAGAFNLGSTMSARDFDLVLKEHVQELLTVAHIFHNASVQQTWSAHRGSVPLTIRERDCLRYLMEGMRYDAIAHAMGLAVVTVEVHVSNARRKLGARTATEAVAKALVRGEISL